MKMRKERRGKRGDGGIGLLRGEWGVGLEQLGVSGKREERGKKKKEKEK